MSLLDRDRSICLVVDLQGKLVQMVERADQVIEGTRRLMEISALFRVPVLLTEQYPQGLGTTEESVRETFDALDVPTAYLIKTSFGCCGDPRFEDTVSELVPAVEKGRRQFVVAGIETHVCVAQTVLELLRLGEEVFVCHECVSGRGASYRRWAMRRMERAGAVITNQESVGFEWARDKNHEAFRDMNRLFRGNQIGADDPV